MSIEYYHSRLFFQWQLSCYYHFYLGVNVIYQCVIDMYEIFIKKLKEQGTMQIFKVYKKSPQYEQQRNACMKPYYTKLGQWGQ